MGSGWQTWSFLHVFFFITFMATGLLINAIQFLLLHTVGYISMDVYRRINFYLVWMLYSQLLFLGTWWAQCKMTIHVQNDQWQDLHTRIGHEHGLIVMNHHYEIDWLSGWMVADHFGVLGNARVFIKSTMKYMPVMGWAWAMSDVGFLHREWERDKDEISRCVRDIQEYPNPAWLLLFPEGTRKTDLKLKEGQEFARSRNMEPFQQHLVPKTKGFVQTMSTLDPQKVPCIYDVTLAVKGNADSSPTLSSILQGKSVEAHVYVKRIPISPEIQADPTTFLMNQFRLKDEIKSRFMEEGKFTDDSRSIETKRHLRVLVAFVLCNVMMLGAWFLLLSSTWFWSSWGPIVVVVLIFSVLYYLMKKMISATEIKKKRD